MLVAVSLQTSGNGQRLVLKVTHVGGLVEPGSRDTPLEEQYAVSRDEGVIGIAQVGFEPAGRLTSLVALHHCFGASRSARARPAGRLSR